MGFLEEVGYLVLGCPALREPEPILHREAWERQGHRGRRERRVLQAFREQPCRDYSP